jgi:hypothetical protein
MEASESFVAGQADVDVETLEKMQMPDLVSYIAISCSTLNLLPTLVQQVPCVSI